jgi:hypothetical protein
MRELVAALTGRGRELHTRHEEQEMQQSEAREAGARAQRYRTGRAP